jgi:hypothetical protein
MRAEDRPRTVVFGMSQYTTWPQSFEQDIHLLQENHYETKVSGVPQVFHG